MSEKALLYVGDLLRWIAGAFAAFLLWWANVYIQPIPEKLAKAALDRAELDKKIVRLQERERHAADDRKRYQSEINRLRDAVSKIQQNN